MQATQTLSKTQLLVYFIFSIFLNSLGNALTVAINLGSALWTAAAVNLSKVMPADHVECDVDLIRDHCDRD